jgi:hypothetical protein
MASTFFCKLSQLIPTSPCKRSYHIIPSPIFQ